METLLTHKKFIKVSVICVALLSLLIAAKCINEIKRGAYIDRGNQPPNTISFNGTGEVTAIPDIATLTFTLSKDATTGKEAQVMLNDQLAKTFTYLKGQNIEDKDIKSEYGGVAPKYDYTQIYCVRYPCPQPDPKVTGYTATQSITVKVRAVDTANDVRTGLAGLGIKDISGPTFAIDNEDMLKDQARAKAIDDARAKAEVLAKQLHVRLGKVTAFSENDGVYPVMYSAKMDMEVSSSAGALAPALPKGENKITSNVSITYEIR